MKSMRELMDTVWKLHETPDDAVHREALKTTGFWGRQGAGCIFKARSTGRVLIAHRSQDVEQPGTWGTWGGAIDSGESPLDAARREVREEAGYHGAFEIEPLLVFRSGDFRYSNFLVEVEDEFEPVLNWESQGSQWCEIGQWPSPLHFGLQALLSDSASMRTLEA